MTMKLAMVAGLLMVVAGCTNYSPLTQRYEPERAGYGDAAIPAPPPPVQRVETPNPSPVGDPTGPTVIEQVKGTWTYTVPPTVTRLEKKSGDVSQASLYNGRPAATDVPFMVITVTPNAESLVENEKETYTVTGERTYVFNGSVVNERKGKTKTGGAFVELIYSNPKGAAEVCHVMAVARTKEERELALQILNSVVWKPVDTASAAPTE